MPFALGSIHTRHVKKPYSTRFLMLVTLISFPLLSACSHDIVPQNTAPLNAQTPTMETTVDKSKIKALLNAEFTLQREGPNKAFESFYELASQSKDITLVERLTYIAIISQNNLYVERSTNLWLSIDPTAEAAYALKLQVLIKGHRSEEVTTLLTNAMRQNVPLRFLPLYLEENVRDSEQVSTIEEAITALPLESKNNQYIQLSYAHLLLLSGEYQSAVDISERLLARATSEKTETLYLILAFSQKNLGKLNDAIETLHSAVQRFPQDTRVLTPLIDFLVENKQPASATQVYQSANLLPSEQLQTGINLMRTLLEHNEPQLALATADSFPKKQLGLADQIQFLSAIAFAQLNQKSKAIATMEKVDGTLRTNATNQMALWFYDEGEEAKINNMVLGRTPRENMPEQVAAISQIHEEKGNVHLSYELLQQALITLPESDVLRYRKALLAEAMGNWAVTETELKILVQKDPDNPQYLNALGYTLLTRTQRIDEAMSYIESAYEKADTDPAIIDSLGWGLFLKGNLEQSSYYLKKAWSILPDAEIAAHYGESLWKQRHYEEAIEVWKTALETSPDTPLLLDTVKRLSPSLLEELKQDQTS